VINPLIFRQYDIRGIAETDLTSEVVALIGRALGTWVREREGKRIAVGRDGRVSGARLRDALIKGVRQAGVDVLDVGMLPTPVLYFSQHNLDVHGAVQITGSHNPPEFNGFKLLIQKETLYGDTIQEIYRRIQAKRFQTGEGKVRSEKVIPAYISHVVNDVKLKRPLRVALDSGNGVGGLVGPSIFRKLGCEVIELYSEVDGTFPNHHPDPTVEKNLVVLRETVLREKLDFGVAYDGDADRIGVIDDKGQILWGDRLLALFARNVLKVYPGSAIVGEVKCSKALYEDVARHGGQPIMWKTGHSLIKAKLRESGAKLAGEMSGHIFFNDRYYGFDDALYASARLAEIIASDNLPLSQLLNDLPLYPVTPEMRIDCPDEIKFQIVEKVADYFRAEYDVVDIDGVRVNFEHGWGLVRASNTQPVLVLRFEADTQERVDEYRKNVEAIVARIRREL